MQMLQIQERLFYDHLKEVIGVKGLCDGKPCFGVTDARQHDLRRGGGNLRPVTIQGVAHQKFHDTAK